MNLLQFLRITHKRFTAKSPIYFKVFTNVSLICAVIISLPEFFSYMDIVVPSPLEPFISRAIAIASFTAAFVSKLTVDDSSTLNNQK